jgi:hypothetical protein
MRRLILGALVVIACSLGTVKAQDFGVQLGVRLEGVPTAVDPSRAAYPALGGQLGLEVQFAQVGVGGRISVSNFLLLLWRFGIDFYGSYLLPDGLRLYAGAGASGVGAAFVGGGYWDVHALLGVRFGSGFFLEATPGIAFAQTCTQTTPPMTMDAVVRPLAQPCYAYQDLRIPMIGISIGWVWAMP